MLQPHPHDHVHTETRCSGATRGAKTGKLSKTKKSAKAVKEVPVLKRSSRKRKAPASADASPAQSAPVVTHDRSIRKRARAAAPELPQVVKPKRGRGAKKGVQTPPEHAVAQAVPQHLTAQHGQVAQHVVTAQPGQDQAQASVTGAVDSTLLQGSATEQPSGGSPLQARPGPAQSPGQSSHPSALLQLAQQQMQQHLHTQPSTAQQQGTGKANQAPTPAVALPLAATAENSQLLGALGNATAQQAYLAQLISQQAAQANVHPFLLAAPYLAQLQQQAHQLLPVQSASEGSIKEQDQSQQQQVAQQLMPQLQQVAATVALQQAVASQMPLLYAGHMFNQAGMLPVQQAGNAAVSVQDQVQDVPLEPQQQQQPQIAPGAQQESAAVQSASSPRDIAEASDMQPGDQPVQAVEAMQIPAQMQESQSPAVQPQQLAEAPAAAMPGIATEQQAAPGRSSDEVMHEATVQPDDALQVTGAVRCYCPTIE